MVDEDYIAAFKKLIEEARQQLLGAQTHLDIWEALHPTEQVVDLLNLYKGFFIPTRDAHRDRFFIKTHNVTDTDRRAPSFHRILRMIKDHPDLAPDVDLRDLSARLKKQRVVLNRIGTFRDRRVAHWDSDVLVGSILLGECRRLLEELEDIFNVIHVSHTGGGGWSFRYWDSDDTSALLDALKDVMTRAQPDER